MENKHFQDALKDRKILEDMFHSGEHACGFRITNPKFNRNDVRNKENQMTVHFDQNTMKGNLCIHSHIKIILLR